MTSYTISRWRQRWRFVFDDATLLRRSKLLSLFLFISSTSARKIASGCTCTPDSLVSLGGIRFSKPHTVDACGASILVPSALAFGASMTVLPYDTNFISVAPTHIFNSNTITCTCLLSRRESGFMRQACSSVCLSVVKMQKRDFLKN